MDMSASPPDAAAAALAASATPSDSGMFPSRGADQSLSDGSVSSRCKCFHVNGPIDQGKHRRDRRSAVYSNLRKVGAEFVGTFILVFSAVAGPIVNQKYNGVESLIGNAACGGLAVMIIIFSFGHISGAHFNPAVTIAFAATRHFPLSQVPGYILAQITASLCASFALKGIFHPFMSGGVTIPSIGTGQAFVLELLVTFTLMLVIVAVATDARAVGELAGVAIGGTVLLNILVAGPSTGGSMNPARTLGPAVAAGNYKGLWIYFFAPILGALAGASVYTSLKIKDEEPELPCKLRCFGRSDTCVWNGFTVAIRNCNAKDDNTS